MSKKENARKLADIETTSLSDLHNNVYFAIYIRYLANAIFDKCINYKTGDNTNEMKEDLLLLKLGGLAKMLDYECINFLCKTKEGRNFINSDNSVYELGIAEEFFPKIIFSSEDGVLYRMPPISYFSDCADDVYLKTRFVKKLIKKFRKFKRNNK